eukprot:SAG11_NODE_765_length_7275_cov_16.594203_2_plen_56_part_00
MLLKQLKPHGVRAEGMALARWGTVGLFGVYWLLGPSHLRDDLFFILPASMPPDEE